MAGQSGFFEIEERLEELSSKGNGAETPNFVKLDICREKKGIHGGGNRRIGRANHRQAWR
jgi:hypothetical protein